MHLRCEALDTPVWRAWLGADEHGVAIGGPGLADLEALLLRAEADEHCRVLVLASEASEFCSGMDLRGVMQLDADGRPDPRSSTHAPADGTAPASQAADVPAPASQADATGPTSQATATTPVAGVAAYARVLGLLRGSRVATICVVDGAASGGGVGLAAACDLVIAGPRASFRLPELFLGLIPAVVLPVLAERTGPARARALALTGDAIDGEAALRIGLVDERSDDPDRSLAARIKYLLRCSPDAVTRLKRYSAAIAGMTVPDALAAGAARTGRDVARPEVRAAVAGFLAGELPPWAVRPGDRR